MDKQKEMYIAGIKLVQELQNGNEAAFEQLYMEYYDYIYRIGWQYFRDEGKAEEIVQETFILVYKNIERLAAPEAFLIWINRIAYNCCHSSYRKIERDAIAHADADKEGDLENLPAMYLDEQESGVKEIVIKTLEQIKPDIRIVGYLYFFEELSYKEISDITGVPMGTVSSRINRLKDKLKIALERHHIKGESCMAILLFPSLTGIYSDYVRRIPGGAAKNQEALKKIRAQKPCSKPKSRWGLIGIVLTAAIPAAALSYQAYYNNYTGKAEEIQIQEISYPKALTNQALPVNVKLSGNAYDDVLLDGSEKFSVAQNGTHNIKVYKDGKVLDQAEFEVTNIDTIPPEVSETETDEYVKLELRDDNGIDYDHTKVQVNGGTGTEYDLRPSENAIYIDKSLQHAVWLSIADKAGNKIEVDVRFYEVYK